jgi:hypothetical protein
VCIRKQSQGAGTAPIQRTPDLDDGTDREVVRQLACETRIQRGKTATSAMKQTSHMS